MIKLVELIKRPKIENGIEYVGERLVLARHGQLELWWARGGNCWTSVGEQAYYPAELQLARVPSLSDDLAAIPFEEQILHKGGRLSKKLLRKYGTKIDAYFGVAVADCLDPKKTVVVS